MIQGIDISHHNKNVIWGLVPAWVEFVICKATEGPGYTDPMFLTYWSALRGSRFIRGAYHYLRLTMDIPGQADNFFVVAGNTQAPPLVDIELYQGYADDVHYHQTTPKAEIQARILWMLLEVEDRFGVRPSIYTARWYWDQFIKGAPWAKNYRLHVASYKNPPPVLPSDWDAWSMWQYTDKDMVPGISTYVDLNYFNGSRADLEAICTNLEDPGDDEMSVKFRSLVDRLRVRTQANTSGAIVGYLNTGDEVEIDQVAGYSAWGRIARGEHAGKYVCISSSTPFMEMVFHPSAPVAPPVGFQSPVGTEAERRSGQYPPGKWIDANPYKKLNPTGWHTGNDLNLNLPGDWNADRREKVYAIKGGTVRWAGLLGGTWGYVVVIEHDPLEDGTPVWSRYAHLREGSLQVQADQVVETGQELGMIGPFDGDESQAHLHFDIARTNILAANPGHWPGGGDAGQLAVEKNYVDPMKFIGVQRAGGGA